MKVLLDMGHCLQGADTGAIGSGRKEQDCTREIGYKVKSKLEALGHQVIVVSCDSANSVMESLAYRVNTANKNGGDLYLSLHLNAGNGVGFGTEVFTYGAKSFTEAQNVLNEFINLGFRNRGIKDGSGLYVIKNTNMKSMLVECCFIDSSDMDRYNSDNFSSAIVKGICGQLPVIKPMDTPIQPQIKEEKKVKYLVVYGKKEDQPIAQMLAYKIGCPIMDADIPFDYSVVERVFAVGGQGNLPWSGYIKKEDILTGADRWDSMQKVINFKL